MQRATARAWLWVAILAAAPGCRAATDLYVAWDDTTWVSVHVVDTVLDTSEMDVVREQITDQLPRVFANPSTETTVVVTFESQSGFYRRLMAANTGIKTAMTLKNTLGARIQIHSKERYELAVSDILRALQLRTVYSFSTVMTTWVPAASRASQLDVAYVALMSSVALIGLCTCALTCHLSLRHGRKARAQNDG
jgi:hypothetical protein